MEQYYKVKRFDDRWMFVNPMGDRFYSLGVNCVTMTDVNFEDPIGKYGGDGKWFERMCESKLSAIDKMGFNTLAAWHHTYFWGNEYPKTVELSLSKRASKVNTVWGVGFPDVFDESFNMSIHKQMIDCFYGKGDILAKDPGLIGYYTDNELHWWGSSGYWGCNEPGVDATSTGLVDDYIQLPFDAAGKKAWVAFIERKYGDIEALNNVWKSEYSEFEDLLYLQHYKAFGIAFEEDKMQFLELIAETYFKMTSSILKMFDPHHLNLGCRIVGETTPKVVLEVMKNYVDVISVNFYNTLDVYEKYLTDIHEITGKPIMITEFSFCAGREAGFLRNTNGAQNVLVRDQKRRGECYRDFVLSAYKLPFIVGTHWFALYDFGMNRHMLIGNYGLYDLKDNLWEEFSEVVKSTHDMICK